MSTPYAPDPWLTTDEAPPVLTVSQLNAEARQLLEEGFPRLTVEGELSNLARPSSGHLYFSLKDGSAQVRCAMFRRANQGLGFTPEDGAQVQVRARVSLYEARGEFQLIVEQMEPAGDGALRRAFEALKRKLATEGLFEEAAKRPLPALPRQIGVITSPTGAAIRDILATLQRRFPAVPVLVYAVPVQGDGSAERIAATLRRAGERAECDVLILARGGGSLEDLWSFNEEGVARAIRECGLPVISGVGHEVDVTIADLAADWRAPTPTGAASRAVPDRAELMTRLEALATRLQRQSHNQLHQRHQTLTNLQGRLERAHPGRRLRQHAQRLDELEARLGRAARSAMSQRCQRLEELQTRLARQHPDRFIRRDRERLHAAGRRLRRTADATLRRKREHLQALSRNLEAVSPLPTLNRGYAIVQNARNGEILRQADQVVAGDRLAARLASGRLHCTVDRVEAEAGDSLLLPSTPPSREG